MSVNKFEVAVFEEVDVLDDERKRKAATVLAKAGYDREKAKAGKLRTGCVSLAAKTAGVTVWTINYWLNHDPEFIPAIERLKSHLKLQAWQNIEKMGKKSLAANIYMLRVMEPERYDDNIRALEYRYEIEKRLNVERQQETEQQYALPVPVYRPSETKDPDNGERPEAYLELLPDGFDDTAFTESSINDSGGTTTASDSSD